MKKEYERCTFSLHQSFDHADKNVIKTWKIVICVDCLVKPYKEKLVYRFEKIIYPGVDETYGQE